ncbi:MAG TPA: hypothetical protein VK204_11690, partial [Nocardioidaceae bacterium]|nr:hypothetical protein [Nocardioidaceae bacterium]
EHHKPDKYTVGPDLDGAKAADPPTYSAMRTRNYTYVEYVDGARELYDLRRDPHELDNLVSRLPQATLDDLHRNLLALERCHGARECRAADHPSTVRGFRHTTR